MGSVVFSTSEKMSIIIITRKKGQKRQWYVWTRLKLMRVCLSKLKYPSNSPLDEKLSMLVAS